MFFSPFVLQGDTGTPVDVVFAEATANDLVATKNNPKWQTDWTSDFLSDPSISKYSVKAGDDLIALAAYQIRKNKAYVYVLYAESAPHSNPTMKQKEERKYSGIGRVVLAFGIKYSIDSGCGGDIVFEAKTCELARHYEEAYRATKLPSIEGHGIQRYMLADENAWDLFSAFLKEE